MEPVTLTTDRLYLRTFVSADIDEVYVAAQDPDIQRWTTIPSPYARVDAEYFIDRVVTEGWRTDTEYTFALRTEEHGPVVGAIGLHHPRAGAWEVGFWTAKECRGRGYMTEAVLKVARWAFTDLACTRLEWRAEVGNTGSRTVAEKAGFTMEGVLRAGLPNKGTLRDCWIASLLPTDLRLPSPLQHLPS
ncbi:GNAT family N-acetyltransferase [Streptomyces sp. SID8379]|uniref:GNAT family N-acetyltransferase n=1 Tax=unclassified Streptomyces TaxID=2593676 RepID=UPI000475CFBB|nr:MULTISPECIES: GNAT family N-acetyltransferase [unclassified Streptomyces]MYW64691.1 GNAT family N-acetyltransferase [Streptomyces sp. SID8379]